MDQLQHSLLILPSRWCSFPTHTVLIFQQEQNSREWEARGCYLLWLQAWAMLWALGMWIHGSMASSTCQHLHQTHQCLQQWAKVHPLPGRSDVRGTRKCSIRPLSTARWKHPCSTYLMLWEKGNWINLFNGNDGSLLLSSFKLLLDSCYLDF